VARLGPVRRGRHGVVGRGRAWRGRLGGARHGVAGIGSTLQRLTISDLKVYQLMHDEDHALKCRLGAAFFMPTRKLSDGTKAYGRRWERTAKAFLQAHPWCVMCVENGRPGPATVVDHIRPHRYNAALFWDPNNWQGLCKRHHDSDKKRLENMEQLQARSDGMPSDPSHPWAMQRAN